MYRNLIIFGQFLKRDWYAHTRHLTMYIINYTLVLPTINAFAFCYLQGAILFGTASTKTITAMFAGNVCLPLFILTYRIIVPLLYDLQHTRFIEYQISILPARLVLLQRILFTAALAFFLMLPFYPIAKLIAGNQLDTTLVSWPYVLVVLAVSALFCASFNMFAICCIKGPHQLGHLWARCNIPLLVLSSWIPLHSILATFPTVGYIAFLNPMMYVTEGLRCAFLADEQFLSIPTCVIALVAWSALFMLLAWYTFKKRTDHV